MPLFEFYCETCNLKFEAIRKRDETADCPKCGCEAKRLMSVVNYSFGWRLTDRANNERFGPRDEYEPNV